MTSDLEKLMANLSDSERDRLKGAFAADPELAQGLSTMLADLPLIPRPSSCAGSRPGLKVCPREAERWCPRSPTSSRMLSSVLSARAASGVPLT